MTKKHITALTLSALLAPLTCGAETVGWITHDGYTLFLTEDKAACARGLSFFATEGKTHAGGGCYVYDPGSGDPVWGGATIQIEWNREERRPGLLGLELVTPTAAGIRDDQGVPALWRALEASAKALRP